jgi:capsular polysaccharide biosynthesis protein
MIVMLGLLAGIGLGVGALIIAEFLDDSIKSIEDAEQALGFSVVGTIPKIEGL